MRVTVSSDVDVIDLDGGPLPRPGICGLVAGGLDGWYGSPAPRESTTDIPQQDGDYWPSRLTIPKRVVTIRGYISGPSTIDVADASERISDLMCRDLTLTVHDASGRRSSACYLSTDPAPLMKRGDDRFTFSLVLTCPDPLKYGDPIMFSPSGGMLRVENAGRVGSWPSVHVDGGVTALSLSLGSRTVKWSGSANVLDLDLRDMIPSAGVASGQAFRIPPGASIIPVSLSGGGSLSMTVSPAWR